MGIHTLPDGSTVWLPAETLTEEIIRQYYSNAWWGRVFEFGFKITLVVGTVVLVLGMIYMFILVLWSCGIPLHVLCSGKRSVEEKEKAHHYLEEHRNIASTC
jgi:hypothetical protein